MTKISKFGGGAADQNVLTEETSGIPIKHIALNLKKNEHTSHVEPEDLQKELHNIGLTCEFTSIDSLQADINGIVKMLPSAATEGYGFFKYNQLNPAEFREKGAVLSLGEAVDTLDLNATWQADNSSSYMAELSAIGYPEHFDFLKQQQYPGFAGQSSSETHVGADSSHDVIRDTFERLATNISSALVEDLDAKEVEALFVNIIEPSIQPGENYDTGLQNRNIYLVKGASATECDAIGVLNVEWQLKVENYKNKKQEKHQFTLSVTVRTALYTDINELETEFNYLKTVFKEKMFYRGVLAGSIPLPSGVTVYDELPLAEGDTFVHSLPLQTETNEYIEAAVFYAPDAENIGCLDNTDSPASTSYCKSVTSGFTYGDQYKIAAGFSFSVEAAFVKAGMTFGVELTLSEQWSSEQTEEITIEVPAGKKAYLYQGLLHVAILRFSKKTMQYDYVEQEAFKSTLIKTSTNPALEEPASLVKTEKTGEPALWEQSSLPWVYR